VSPRVAVGLGSGAWTPNFGNTPPDPGLYPNEPAGFTRWLEHDFSYMPSSGWAAASGGGYLSTPTNPPNYTVVSDPAAPHGAPHSLRIRFPNALPDGVTPGTFDGRDGNGATIRTLDSWYVSVWFLFEGSDWEAPPATQKFWYNRNTQASDMNLGGMTLGSGVGTRTILSQWYSYRYWHVTSSGGADAVIQTLPGPQLGTWYHMEQVVQLEGTYPAMNAANVKTWINGTLMQNANHSAWAAAPFGVFHWAPVWGGACAGGCARERDDYLRIARLYVSG
jgi:hypothetical protein